MPHVLVATPCELSGSSSTAEAGFSNNVCDVSAGMPAEKAYRGVKKQFKGRWNPPVLKDPSATAHPAAKFLDAVGADIEATETEQQMRKAKRLGLPQVSEVMRASETVFMVGHMAYGFRVFIRLHVYPEHPT